MINPLVQALKNRAEELIDEYVLIDCKTNAKISAIELLDDVKIIAQYLINNNIKKGDIVVITMQAGEDFCKIIYSCFSIGAIPVLIDIGIPTTSLKSCIDELMPKMWIFDGVINGYETTHSTKILECLKSKIQVDDTIFTHIQPTTVCMILYTTGTTGLPKGVPWTASNLASHMHAQKSSYANFNITSEFCFFSHLAIIAISIGRVAIIPNLTVSKPAQVPIDSVILQMEMFGCDYVFASPIFWKRFCDYCEYNSITVNCIKVVTTAGAAVNVKTLNSLEQYIPNAEIFIPYASTEVLMPISNISLKSLSLLTENGTANAKGIPLGISMSDMEVEIISLDNDSSELCTSDILTEGEIGEIIVTGPRTTTEYFKRPMLTKKSKLQDVLSGKLWHRMGDVGYIDNNKCIWFLSRLKYVRKTPYGTLFPDKLEQFYNYHFDIPDSAIVYNELNKNITLIISSDYIDIVHLDTIKIISKKYDLNTPDVIFYPGSLPTDSRHNSKINREELAQWLNDRQS